VSGSQPGCRSGTGTLHAGTAAPPAPARAGLVLATGHRETKPLAPEDQPSQEGAFPVSGHGGLLS